MKWRTKSPVILVRCGKSIFNTVAGMHSGTIWLMTVITSFAPIAAADAKVLVLGSMPGNESLARQQYYAHPRNAFWFIIEHLTLQSQPLNYKQRTALLREHGIALWDVLRACRRRGSLDSAIERDSTVANDFAGFLHEHPSITDVFFNGATAEQAWKRHVLKQIGSRYDYLSYHRLPSTSPAMASLKPEQKLQLWSAIFDGR
jgi:double-stranded uracil-DNA glycosylase